MEDYSREHIETAEFAKLLEESRGRPASLSDAHGLHPHLETCPTCRQKFEDLSALDRQLQETAPNDPTPRPNACPASEVWREIAAGVTSPEETLTLLDHASRCHQCGPALRAAVAEVSALNGETTEAERKHIAALDSARATWQRSLARRITATPDPVPAPHRRWRWVTAPLLADAGAILLVVIVIGSWIAVRRNQPAAARHLLAQAYTEKRTLELRIPGATYAPIRVSRGAATSFTSRPPALLKAEALIASQLESHPSDPAWLQAKAEADILEGKYDAAAETLQHALQLAPGSTAILTDLATPYFQRALADDRTQDLGVAFEDLSRALRQSPDDPTALFNRAIVAEHLFLYRQSLDDWNHYLRLDSNSPWADEARTRATAVQEKLKQHESSAKPLLSPSQIIAAAASPTSTSTVPSEIEQRINERIEEYLHDAVSSWLPQAFPESNAVPDPGALKALFFLADLTTRRHGDQWLADLLRGSSAPHFRRAVNALARAVQANDLSNYNVAAQQAALAEQLFRSFGNPAGTLRAEFELAFQDQISRHGEDCRRRSAAAEVETQRYAYPWVRIQLGLEQGVCSLLMGDAGTYEEGARRAQSRAQQADYGTLYLRALGFMADEKLYTGDRPAAWKLVSTGLDRYWSGQFPALRSYSLYSFAAEAARTADQPNLRAATTREAAAAIDASANLLVRAKAHSYVADAAAAAQLPELAKSEYTLADRFYALAPQTDAIRADRLYSQIMTAQLEARQSALDAALARLTQLQEEVNHLSNDLVVQVFYSTLGEVQLRSHHASEAEHAFRAARRLAEQNLASRASESSRTTWSQDAAPIFLGLAESELLQGREQESLDVFESYLGAPQRAGTRSAAQPASNSPLNPLPPRLSLLSHQTVLAYGVLPDGLAIWVYDNRGLRAKWIPQSPQELQNLSSNFYAECSDPASEPSALRRDSRTLYSLLIAPIEGWLDQSGSQRTLVIETEGSLDRLPFEALMDTNGHYLIERADIVHSPGSYAEAHMHHDVPISADLPALIIGSTAASPDKGLFTLPSIPAATDAVAHEFHSPRILEGPTETLAAIRRALPAAAVFHFAGHAITTAHRTGLLLESGSGQDQAPVLLDADQVRSLKLPNLQLAVLAACSTDSGEGGMRGFDSVASALQTSGVPHVIASRWTVDSVEANAFMDDFYRSLLSGQTVSGATRLTAQKMLSNPRTSHPFYWSVFAAYGRP